MIVLPCWGKAGAHRFWCSWPPPHGRDPESRSQRMKCSLFPDLSSALIFSAPALDSECLCVSDVRAQLAMISRAILNKAPCPQSASIVMSDDDQEPCVSTSDDVKLNLCPLFWIPWKWKVNCSLQFNFLCNDSQIQSSQFCLIYFNV